MKIKLQDNEYKVEWHKDKYYSVPGMSDTGVVTVTCIAHRKEYETEEFQLVMVDADGLKCNDHSKGVVEVRPSFDWKKTTEDRIALSNYLVAHGIYYVAKHKHYLKELAS
jgi:hypothetical protein